MCSNQTASHRAHHFRLTKLITIATNFLNNGNYSDHFQAEIELKAQGWKVTLFDDVYEIDPHSISTVPSPRTRDSLFKRSFRLATFADLNYG
ncbi:hypothetical protein NBRC116587_00030 [Pseudoteredinibacter isoporae]